MKHWMMRLATIGAAAAIIGLWLPVSSATAAVGGARFASNNTDNTGVAGYVLAPAGASASGKAKFTVPTIKGCTSTDSGVAFASLIFTKKSVTGAGVFAECSSGSPVYAAVLVVNGTSTVASFTPAPGDVIKVKTAETATTSTVKLTDVTQAMTAKDSGTGGKKLVVLDGIDALVDSSTGDQLPVPKFGTATYSGGEIDGATVAASGATAYDMETSGGVLQIQTGALNGSGNGWTETFIHS